MGESARPSNNNSILPPATHILGEVVFQILKINCGLGSIIV